MTEKHAYMRAALGLACAGLLAGCSGGWFGKDKEAPLPGERVSVLQMQTALEPDPVPADAPSLETPEAWNNAFWPQAGGYPNHAMQNPALGAGPLTLAWTADIGEGSTRRMPLTAPPVVADGKVFAINGEQTLSAFSVRDGSRLWRASIRKKDEKDSVIGAGAAYSHGVLYVTNGYDQLIGIAAQDGKRLWTSRLPAPARAAPTILDGRVFVSTLDNRLIAFTDKGNLLWEYAGLSETAGLVGGASPAAAGDIVVPAFSSGEIDALQVQNGSVSWSENLAGQRAVGGLNSIADIRGMPVIDRDLVFAISFAGRMVAIDQRTGQRVWQKDIGSDETPWVAGGQVFVLTINNEIVALNRETGAIRWVTPLARNEKPGDTRSDPVFWTGPVMAGGRLIAVSGNGMAVEIDPSGGRVLRQWKTGRGVSLPVAVAGGMLFMLADDGTLLAYR